MSEKNVKSDAESPLEKRLGYRFKNKSLLRTALTHSSFTNEMKSRGAFAPCNERLEFLGDAVISLVTADYIYSRYPDEDEGDLSKLRSQVVRDIALSEYARELGIGQELFLGRGEDNPSGRDRKSTLENAFEAITGAIYLDGGLEAARSFCLPFIARKVKEAEKIGETRDFKTILQEYVQTDPSARLEYQTVGESGPDHCKIFEVEARLNNNVVGTGKGPTKRAAEQAAAKMALLYFEKPQDGAEKSEKKK